MNFQEGLKNNNACLFCITLIHKMTKLQNSQNPNIATWAILG